MPLVDARKQDEATNHRSRGGDGERETPSPVKLSVGSLQNVVDGKREDRSVAASRFTTIIVRFEEEVFGRPQCDGGKGGGRATFSVRVICLNCWRELCWLPRCYDRETHERVGNPGEGGGEISARGHDFIDVDPRFFDSHHPFS
jgi:hypothetical protein